MQFSALRSVQIEYYASADYQNVSDNGNRHLTEGKHHTERHDHNTKKSSPTTQTVWTSQQNKFGLFNKAT